MFTPNHPSVNQQALTDGGCLHPGLGAARQGRRERSNHRACPTERSRALRELHFALGEAEKIGPGRGSSMHKTGWGWGSGGGKGREACPGQIKTSTILACQIPAGSRLLSEPSRNKTNSLVCGICCSLGRASTLRSWCEPQLQHPSPIHNLLSLEIDTWRTEPEPWRPGQASSPS